MTKLTEAEFGYFAGLIDGEGTISLTRSNARSSGAYVYPLVRIANTNRAIIEWLAAKWPRGSVRYSSKMNAGCKDVHHWGVAAQDAWELLETVEPYLVAKKQQAEVALALKDENEAWLKLARRENWGNYHPVPQELRHFREACSLYMHDLNRRGVAGFINGKAVMSLVGAMDALEATRLAT